MCADPDEPKIQPGGCYPIPGFSYSVLEVIVPLCKNTANICKLFLLNVVFLWDSG